MRLDGLPDPDLVAFAASVSGYGYHNTTTDGKYFSSCETVKYVEDFAVNINTFSRAAFFVAHQGDQSSAPR